MIEIKFCVRCGHAVDQIIPEGDGRVRAVCKRCHHIHYQNPLNVVGAIPYWDNKVLLCRRAIEPRAGFWTLPAGFMELNETVEQAAMRETWEESGAQIDIAQLMSVLSVPMVGQVHLFFLAPLKSPQFLAGVESLEVGFFTREQIPWNEIAFETVRRTLRYFYEWHDAGRPEDYPVLLSQVDAANYIVPTI